MTERLRNLTLWTVLGLFALFNAAKPWIRDTPLAQLVPAVSILSMLGFVLFHGPRQIGWRRLTVFFVITFIVSWSYESLSIATGFPFGHYHYTDEMGPKLGAVPLLIMPAYYSVCYVSWHLGQLVLDRFDQRPDVIQTFVVPVLAAFIMVMWDMSMDPSRATVAQAWVWHDGGAYFGVPFENFMGWLLCVWTIFQLYALTLRRNAQPQGSTGTPTDTREHWYQMIGLYAALSLEFIMFALIDVDGTVTDEAGVVWRLQDLYQSLGLVAIFSMVFVVLLCVAKVHATTRIGADA